VITSRAYLASPFEAHHRVSGKSPVFAEVANDSTSLAGLDDSVPACSIRRFNHLRGVGLESAHSISSTHIRGMYHLLIV